MYTNVEYLSTGYANSHSNFLGAHQDGVGPPEGAIIALVAPLALGWMALCMLTSLAFIVPADGFID